MKTLRSLIITLLFAFTAGSLVPATVRADDAPSFDYFYENLQPYGQWVQVEGYGYCWQPNNVDENWQPYTDGYWAYTDDGWTWVSYEDFGWITYHYGRWTRVEDAGWVWVPGYEWGPAWVSWRQSDDANAGDDADLIGWAPLPPEAHFRRGIGISVWADSAYGIGPAFFSFCRVRDFGSPVLGPVIIDRSRNVTIINNTTNITNITTNNNVIYNGGPNYNLIAKHTDPAHPIQTLHIVRQTDPGYFRKNGNKGMAQAQGNQLIVAAPQLTAPKKGFKPTQQPAKVFNKPKIDKGWSKIQDPQQKQQLQAAIQAQNKGIKPQQPARPVTAQQLAVIPKVSPAAGQPPVTPPVAGAQPTPFNKKGFKGKPPVNPAAQPPAGAAGQVPPAPQVPNAAVNPNPAVQPVPPAGVKPTPFNKKGFKAPHQTPPVNPAAQPPAAGNPPVAPAPQQTPPPKKFQKRGAPTPVNNAVAQPPAAAAGQAAAPQTPAAPVQPNNAAVLQQQKAAAAAAQRQQAKQAQQAQQAQQIQQQKAAAAAAAQQQHAAQQQQQIQQQKAAANAAAAQQREAAAQQRAAAQQQRAAAAAAQQQHAAAAAAQQQQIAQQRAAAAAAAAKAKKPVPTPVPGQ